MIDDLKKNLKKRILILDGPMGTIIQNIHSQNQILEGKNLKFGKSLLKETMIF